MTRAGEWKEWDDLPPPRRSLVRAFTVLAVIQAILALVSLVVGIIQIGRGQWVWVAISATIFGVLVEQAGTSLVSAEKYRP